MIQILTPTGVRPEAFRLCQRWMARQTYDGPVIWIVVDDGEVESPIEELHEGWQLVKVRPNPYWTHGWDTQRRNLQAGLMQVDNSRPLVIVEDDDWYAPHWIARVAEHLKEHKLVGEAPAKYYNILTGCYSDLPNNAHSSLCSSAMRDEVIISFRNIVAHAVGIDIPLWQSCSDSYLFRGNDVVGMKGLPGRPGIGSGHRGDFGIPDLGRAVLRRWVGEDAKYYV